MHMLLIRAMEDDAHFGMCKKVVFASLGQCIYKWGSVEVCLERVVGEVNLEEDASVASR